MLKMKVKNLDIAYPVIDKLAKLSTEGKLKFSANYKLNKISKLIAPEMEDFFNERKKLLDKYCKEIVEKKIEDGKEVEIKTGTWIPIPEHSDKFIKYMDELHSFDIELGNVSAFTEEDLENISELSFIDIDRLGPFFAGNTEATARERKPIKINIED